MSDEKKLTDEEIVKAILQSIEYSKTITYFDEWGNCEAIMITDILDLIHRLQSENAGLKERGEIVINSLHETIDKQKAEIELHKIQNSKLEYELSSLKKTVEILTKLEFDEQRKTYLCGKCQERVFNVYKEKETQISELKQQIGEQKAEIERLTEDYEERLCTAANVYQVALDEKSELQKKVDELKEERENMQAVIFGLEEDKRQLLKRLDEEFVSLKAVKAAENSPKAMKMLVESVGCVQKDTAKEIFTGIKESFVFAFIGASEDYEKGYCDALKDYDKQLRDFAKEEYDVEVE